MPAEGTMEPPGGAKSPGVEPWTNVQVGDGSRVVAYLWEWVDDRPRRLLVLRSRHGFARAPTAPGRARVGR